MKILPDGSIAAVPAGDAPGGFYDAQGRVRYTEATTERGVYAPDGSVYVEVTNGITGSGIYNARGNWRVTRASGSKVQAANGSLRITDEADVGYVAQAVHFDGSTYLTCASGTAVNNGLFSASFWVKMVFTPETANQRLFIVAPEGDYTPGIEMHSNGPGLDEASFNLYSTDYANGCQIGNQFQTLRDEWHHILMSGDMSNQVGQIYLDDIPQRDLDPNFINSGGNPTGGTLSVNGLPWRFGGDGFPGDNLDNADVADVWIALGVSLLDESNNIPEVTRRLFITAEGKPANPSGFPAASIIFYGPAASFVINRGTAGSFSTTGSLTDALTSPSD